MLPFMYESIVRSNHRFTTYAHNSTDQANMNSNIMGGGDVGSGGMGSASGYNLSNSSAYGQASSSSSFLLLLWRGGRFLPRRTTTWLAPPSSLTRAT